MVLFIMIFTFRALNSSQRWYFRCRVPNPWTVYFSRCPAKILCSKPMISYTPITYSNKRSKLRNLNSSRNSSSKSSRQERCQTQQIYRELGKNWQMGRECPRPRPLLRTRRAVSMASRDRARPSLNFRYTRVRRRSHLYSYSLPGKVYPTSYSNRNLSKHSCNLRYHIISSNSHSS